jgi:vanillate O-demethylase ferredoxin subunit
MPINELLAVYARYFRERTPSADSTPLEAPKVRSVSPTLRTLVLQFHRWTGLTVGMLLLFMASTGALIAYRPYLEPIVNRDLLTVPACADRKPLDALAADARAVHPAGELDYIRITAAADHAERIPATQVRLSDPDFQDDVYLDPCSGQVVGQRARYDGFLAAVERLHRFRFVEGGGLIAGTTALVCSIMLIGGGLYMWWPRRLHGWKSAAKLNPRLTGRDRTLNRHKIIGLYASLIVLASALTGLPQSFDWYRKAIYFFTGSPTAEARPQSAPAPGLTRLPMEAYWQRARSLVPDPKEALLHFPVKPSDPVEIYMIARDAPHANARTMLFLDAYTGNVLRFTPYAQSSLGHKLYFWTLSWHTGQVGGLFGPVVLLLGALSVPVLAYTGASSYVRRKFRKSAGSARLEVRVVRKELEATDICTFELAEPLGNKLPNFSAGSHIDVHVREGLVRQYSLCNDPRETHRYLIGVLRVPDSRGGSSAMHDDVQEGDLLEIGEPRNHFPLAHSAKRSLLVAGGIGVTPILCMAERLANVGAAFEMHYCTRSRDRTAFVERIARSVFASHVTFHFDDGPPEQRVDIGALLEDPRPDTHLYVCGPKGFMDFVIGTARQKGWPPHRVHKEYFSAAVRTMESDTEFDVQLASTGKTYRIAKDKTVVTALRAHGIEIPTSCEQGVCGTCLTRVIDGEPEHRDIYQSDDERARNDQFTPCCSRSKTPTLVLDL